MNWLWTETCSSCGRFDAKIYFDIKRYKKKASMDVDYEKEIDGGHALLLACVICDDKYNGGAQMHVRCLTPVGCLRVQ